MNPETNLLKIVNYRTKHIAAKALSVTLSQHTTTHTLHTTIQSLVVLAQISVSTLITSHFSGQQNVPARSSADRHAIRRTCFHLRFISF